MPSKWVSTCLSIFAKRASGWSTKAFCFRSSFVLGLLIGLIPQSQAILTISPNNGGSVSPASTGGTTLHYFVQFAGSPPLADPAFFLPVGFTPLDPTVSSVNDNLKNAFTLNIKSNVAITAPTLVNPRQAVITFFAYPNTGTPHPAPIAAVNDVPCTRNNGDGNCLAYRQVNVGVPNLYYAVKYPAQNATLKISFYPNDVCAVATAQGIPLAGCSGGAFIPPAAGTPTIMQFGFNVQTSADGLPTTAPSGTPLDTTANPVTFAFQVDTPTFVCPSLGTLNNSITPGDGSIALDPSAIRTTVASGAATPQNLFVVGNDQALPDVSKDFNSFPAVKNQILQQVGWGGLQRVDGFKNSSNGDIHPYQLSFIIQDRAGIYVPPSKDGKTADPEACLLNPVETASIQAFLGKSNCFIATAAFASIESPPVLLLRKFRDEILLKTDLGTAFVHGYYRWSPGPAEWLIRHEIFRIPVLLLLAPLELFAWLCLHPSIMMSLCGIYFLVLAGVGFASWRGRVLGQPFRRHGE